MTVPRTHFLKTLSGIHSMLRESDRFVADYLATDPQRNLPFLRITNHKHLFYIIGKNLQC